jgi:hypothetical protein
MTNNNENHEVTNEELESAAEFYDGLELDDPRDFTSGLDALEEETRLADADWDAHWEAMDMDLLDVSGEIHDYDYDN